MSDTYLINGTQLTIDGGQATTLSNPATIALGSSGNTVTVQNYAGQLTLTGTSGTDSITVDAGGGGSVAVSDPGSTLQVVAPTTRAANVTASAGSISLTSGDTVTYTSNTASVSLAGQLFSNGDALTVNGSGGNTIAIGASTVALGGGTPTIYYSTFNGITVNGGASDNLSLSGDSIPTTLNAGSGNVAFNVSTNSVALAINGGSGSDTYTINSNSGQLTATGGTGNSTFTVYGSSSSMTLNGGSATNLYTIQSNSASLNINGGGTANTVIINGNSSSITARGGTGSIDSFTINSTTGQIALTGGVGSTTTYTIAAPTVAAITITGSTTGTNALTFDGTALNNAFSITTNSVNAGSEAAVGFTHLTSLTVNGIGGNDSFLVNSDTVPTILNGAAGNDTFNIQSESGGISVTTGTGVSTVNLGSNAPLSTNNLLSGLTGAVTVIGDNSDTLNLNDAADTTARTVALNSTGIIGLGFGGLSYSGLATMNVKLGSGGNTVAVNSTAAGLVTNFNTGSGANSVYLGSNTSSTVMTGFAGALNLTGGGSDTLSINDSGDPTSQTVTVSPTTVLGLSPAPISYTGSAALTVNLGTGGNTLSITNTHAGTSVAVHGGVGNDTLKIVADASPVSLTTGGGSDTVLVQSIAAATSISSSGNSAIDVGSTAPAAGGVLSGIAAGLTVTGAGTDTLNADDSGDLFASTGILNATTVYGLGMNSAGISYSGLSNLNLSLGTASNTLTVSNTYSGTATLVTGGPSADSITLVADASPTTISGGAGNDHINVQSVSAVTSIITGGGNDVVYVGNNAPATPSSTGTIAATLTVVGGGGTALDLDDTGDNVSKTATITATAVTGISGGAGIAYSGLSVLNLTMGTGGNTVDVNGTAVSATTSINTGAGNDVTNITATSGITDINDGLGTNTVNVGSNAPSNTSVTTNIAGAINLTANAAASDTLNLQDASDALPRVATLTSTTMTGISPAPIGYAGFSALNVFLGSANSSLTISNTMSGSTLVDTGLGDDSVTLQHDSGATTLRGSNSSYLIQNAAAATTVNALGPDQVIVGNPITGGRTLAGITATVNINGNSETVATVDDSADATVKTGILSSGAITNLSTGTIDYQNLTSLNLNLGSAGNTLGVTGTSAPTTITGGAGDDVLNIQADSATLTLAAGLGHNVVNLGSNAPAVHGNVAGITAAVTVTGTGIDTLNIDDTGDATVRSAGLLTATTVGALGGATINYTGQTALNLSLGNAADVLFVTGTAAGTSTAAHTGTAGSTVDVQATAGVLSVVSGAADTVNVGSNAPASSLLNTIAANIAVTGLGNDTLNIDDNSDLSNATGAVGATAVTGLGASGSVAYTGVSQLNINLGTGNDVFAVNSTASGTSTAINGTGGNSLSVLNTSSAVAITSPGTIVIGSTGNSGGTIAAVTGPVTLTGDGTDSLLIQDVADTTARTGTLSASQLTLGPAVVNYTGAATLAISLGRSGDGFTINNTNAATPVTLNGGTGTDTLSVGTDASSVAINAGSATSIINVGTAGHVIDGLTAPLTITGTGTNPLNVNDTGSTIAKTGTVSSTAITGFATDGINYSGLGTLGLSLGSGGNTVQVNSTAASTVTTINSGSGNDTVNVAGTGGTTNINTQAGNDITNISATGATTNVNDGTGTNTVNVGSNAPAGNSITTNIAGALNLTGNTGAIDTLNLLDAADAVSRTAVLTATTMTGISPATIGYTGYSIVDLYMGTASSSLTVSNTITGNTQINTSTGDDAITVQNTSGPTTVQTGNSTVAVQNIAAATEIDSLAPNQITVGNPTTVGRSLAGINATLTLDGTTGSTALVDDSADSAVKTATLTSTTLTGLSTGAIDYSELVSLSVNLGTAGDTVGVASTSTPTTITGGNGADTVNVQSDSAALTLSLGAGHNTINIGSNAPASAGTLTGLASPITVSGTGIDTLNVDDTGDATVRSAATLTGSSISGLGGATINYTGQTALNLDLGNAVDTLAVTGTSAGTSSSVRTGTAGSTVNVRATTGVLAVISNAADTVNVGSNAPANSVLSTIAGALTVTGLGSDTLSMSDAADQTNATGSLTGTALTGLNAAAVNYTGVSNLNLSLGTGNDTFAVNGTAAATATAITGSGTNAISVTATSSTLSITSPGQVNLGSNVASLTGPISITGNGIDALTLTDTADTTPRTGTLSPTQITLGPANISYTGAANLAVTLGSGGDGFTVNGTASTTPVTLNGGTGVDTLVAAGDSSSTTIRAGSISTVLNVGNAGIVDGLTAPLTITGAGSNPLNIDDSGSTIAKTGSLTSTDLTGLNTAGIQYSGIGQLGIKLGSGGNNFNISSAATPTTLTAGTGQDHLLLSGTDETTNSLAAPITINGNGNAQLKLDDTASTTAKTLNLTGSTLSGLSPAVVNYSNLADLTIDLGAGHDTANVQGTAVPTTITGNAGGESFNVTPGSLAAPITLTGNGTDPLVVNNSASTVGQTATFAVGQISGLGGPINYTGMASVSATLGSGGDTAIVSGADAAVPTTIDGGPGANAATINIAGDLPGHLSLMRFQTGTVNVSGSLTGTLSTDGSFSTVTTGADLSGTLSVAGTVSTITLGGNLTGDLAVAGSVGTATVDGNLAGKVSVGGDVASLHVKGGFETTGALNVIGALKLLELDGADSGASNVGSLQGLVVSDVTPTANGTIFSLTQNGVTRSIQALAANEITGFAGTTFSTVYDDSTGSPQAAVRVNGGVASERFDLLLNAPAGSSFSLSRLDSAGDAATQVRNVVIDGSLLSAVTPAQASYFGYAANTIGGVYLPADNLAAVSARDVMAPGTIWAKSIQGIAYSSLLGSSGEIHPGTRIAVSQFKEKLLLSTLALNPKTHKAYTTVVAPTETLLVPAGTVAAPSALYAGHAGGLQLDTNGVIVWDRDAGQSALASLTFSSARVNGEQVINQLAWQGTGGSVESLRVISNISSTGPLGDVLLGAGKVETLQSVTAPSIEGTIDLYGGKLVGTIQTTVGDLGSADGSSRIEDFQMTSTAQIISRGNLFSSVSLTGNLTGTIAAQANIAGDILVSGKGNSTGSVIAFGALTAPVTIAGSFSGQMAAGGTAGIQGDVSVDKGILKGGSIVSSGNIGDLADGTALTSEFVRGLVVADGTTQMHIVHAAPGSPAVESAGPGGNAATAAVLATIWSPAGTPLAIDESSDDLAGL
jgi:hypothetical protein